MTAFLHTKLLIYKHDQQKNITSSFLTNVSPYTALNKNTNEPQNTKFDPQIDLVITVKRI